MIDFLDDILGIFIFCLILVFVFKFFFVILALIGIGLGLWVAWLLVSLPFKIFKASSTD